MMGKVKNCPVCGKIYQEIGQKMCRDCYNKMLDKEREVINYVRDHPKSKIPEIIEATGAHEKLIRKLISEGRFEQVGVKMTYPCEKCGAPIITGKLCSNCQESLHKDLLASKEKIDAAKKAIAAQSMGVGMHSKKK